MVEVTDETLLLDQLERITSVLPVLPSPSSHDPRPQEPPSDSSMEEHSDEDELDLALLRAAEKRSSIPNSLGMAFEPSSALLQAIATDRGVDLSTDSNLLEVLAKMVQHSDQLANALGLVKEQLASLQHVSSVNDELVVKVLHLEDTCGKSSSNPNSLNQKPNLWLYAERLEVELKAEQQRSCDLEARANLLEGTTEELNTEMDGVHRAFSKQRRKYRAMKQGGARTSPAIAGSFKDELDRQYELMVDQGDIIKKIQLRMDEQTNGQGTGTRTMFYGGKSLNCKADVYALLAGSNVPGSFAAIPSIYQIGSRMSKIMTGDQGDSLADQLKIQKLAKELDMSEEECLHISMAGQRRIGFLSGTRKVGKTEYSGHGTGSFKEWRDESNGVGFAYDLERALVTVEDEYNSIIEMYFTPTFDSSSLRNLAYSVLAQSLSFLKKFIIIWTDATYRSLTINHTPEDQAWWIITKVWKAIFEDFLGPARVVPTSGGLTGGALSARYIWPTLQIHLLYKELEDKEIKNHHIVHGVYSEWLVAHSGRREADVAKAEAMKATAAVAEFRATIKKLEDQVDKAKKESATAKKVADRAISQVKSPKNG